MKGDKRDDWLVRIANFFLRRASRQYQDNLNMVIGLGLAAMDAELAKRQSDVVDSEKEPRAKDRQMDDELFPAEDVDTTSRYVSHPTWKLFGDELLTPGDESDRLSSTGTDSTGSDTL